MRSARRAPLALLRMRRASTHAQQPNPAVRRRAACACAAPLPPRLYACAVPPNAAHAPYATPPRPSAAHAQSRRAPSRACALRNAAPPPRRSAQAQCPPSPPSPPPKPQPRTRGATEATGGALCVVAAVPVRPGGGLLPPGWASAFGRFRLAARRRCPRGLGLSVWEREAAALARSSRWSPGGFRRGAVRALYVRRGALSMVSAAAEGLIGEGGE